MSAKTYVPKKIEVALGFELVTEKLTDTGSIWKIELRNPLGREFKWLPTRAQFLFEQRRALEFAKKLAQAHFEIAAPEGFKLATVEEKPARESGFYKPLRHSKAAKKTDKEIGKSQWLLHAVGDWTAVFVPKNHTGIDTHPHSK